MRRSPTCEADQPCRTARVHGASPRQGAAAAAIALVCIISCAITTAQAGSPPVCGAVGLMTTTDSGGDTMSSLMRDKNLAVAYAGGDASGVKVSYDDSVAVFYALDLPDAPLVWAYATFVEIGIDRVEVGSSASLNEIEMQCTACPDVFALDRDLGYVYYVTDGAIHGARTGMFTFDLGFAVTFSPAITQEPTAMLVEQKGRRLLVAGVNGAKSKVQWLPLPGVDSEGTPSDALADFATLPLAEAVRSMAIDEGNQLLFVGTAKVTISNTVVGGGVWAGQYGDSGTAPRMTLIVQANEVQHTVHYYDFTRRWLYYTVDGDSTAALRSIGVHTDGSAATAEQYHLTSSVGIVAISGGDVWSGPLEGIATAVTEAAPLAVYSAAAAALDTETAVAFGGRTTDSNAPQGTNTVSLISLSTINPTGIQVSRHDDPADAGIEWPPAMYGAAIAVLNETTCVVFGGLGNAVTGDDAFRAYLLQVGATTDPPVWTSKVTTNGLARKSAVGLAALWPNVVVQFGGQDDMGSYVGDDTRLLDISEADWAWTTVSAEGPASRRHHCMGGNANGMVVVFGGRLSSGTLAADTWVLTAASPGESASWTELSHLAAAGRGPDARAGAACSMDARRENMFMAGGYRETGALDDVYAFSFAYQRWRDVAETSVAAFGATAVLQSRFLVVGGASVTVTSTGASLTSALPGIQVSELTRCTRQWCDPNNEVTIVARATDDSSDAVCAPECSAGQYGMADDYGHVTCQLCKECDANQYESVPCGGASDRQCRPIRPCAADEVETAPPTATSDRQCARWRPAPDTCDVRFVQATEQTGGATVSILNGSLAVVSDPIDLSGGVLTTIDVDDANGRLITVSDAATTNFGLVDGQLRSVRLQGDAAGAWHAAGQDLAQVVDPIATYDPACQCVYATGDDELRAVPLSGNEDNAQLSDEPSAPMVTAMAVDSRRGRLLLTQGSRITGDWSLHSIDLIKCTASGESLIADESAWAATLQLLVEFPAGHGRPTALAVDPVSDRLMIATQSQSFAIRSLSLVSDPSGALLSAAFETVVDLTSAVQAPAQASAAAVGVDPLRGNLHVQWSDETAVLQIGDVGNACWSVTVPLTTSGRAAATEADLEATFRPDVACSALAVAAGPTDVAAGGWQRLSSPAAWTDIETKDWELDADEAANIDDILGKARVVLAASSLASADSALLYGGQVAGVSTGVKLDVLMLYDANGTSTSWSADTDPDIVWPPRMTAGSLFPLDANYSRFALFGGEPEPEEAWTEDVMWTLTFVDGNGGAQEPRWTSSNLTNPAELPFIHRYSSVCAVDAGVIVEFGSFPLSSSPLWTTRVLFYNDNSTWMEPSWLAPGAGGAPVRQLTALACSIDARLAVTFGGVTSVIGDPRLLQAPLGDTWILHADDGLYWEEVPRQTGTPSPRFGHSLAIYTDGGAVKAFVCGGYNAQWDVHFDDLHVLDVATRAWSRVAFAPTSSPADRIGRVLGSMAVFSGDMVTLFGGSLMEQVPPTYQMDLLRWDDLGDFNGGVQALSVDSCARARCADGLVAVREATLTDDAVCAEPCAASMYRRMDDALNDPDGSCVSCSVCDTTSQWMQQPCKTTEDAVCVDATVCVAGETFEVTPLGAEHDRVCAPVTQCVNGVTFESVAPTAILDRVCAACSTVECTSDSFMVPCSVTADAACEACTECASGAYATEECTASTDRVCGMCHPSCATCNGPASTDCISCNEPNSVVDALSGECRAVCTAFDPAPAPLNASTGLVGGQQVVPFSRSSVNGIQEVTFPGLDLVLAVGYESGIEVQRSHDLSSDAVAADLQSAVTQDLAMLAEVHVVADAASLSLSFPAVYAAPGTVPAFVVGAVEYSDIPAVDVDGLLETSRNCEQGVVVSVATEALPTGVDMVCSAARDDPVWHEAACVGLWAPDGAPPQPQLSTLTQARRISIPGGAGVPDVPATLFVAGWHAVGHALMWLRLDEGLRLPAGSRVIDLSVGPISRRVQIVAEAGPVIFAASALLTRYVRVGAPVGTRVEPALVATGDSDAQLSFSIAEQSQGLASKGVQFAVHPITGALTLASVPGQPLNGAAWPESGSVSVSVVDHRSFGSAIAEVEVVFVCAAVAEWSAWSACNGTCARPADKSRTRAWVGGVQGTATDTPLSQVAAANLPACAARTQSEVQRCTAAELCAQPSIVPIAPEQPAVEVKGIAAVGDAGTVVVATTTATVATATVASSVATTSAATGLQGGMVAHMFDFVQDVGW